MQDRQDLKPSTRNAPADRTVIVITGPTASGKSVLAHAAAKKINAEIVSADSRQIYCGMDIGTAKPDSGMLRERPYHFISEKKIDEDYSAGDFVSDALGRLKTIVQKGNNAIVVGGSTLYIEGLLQGFADLPGKDPETRCLLEEELKTKGNEALYQRLRSLDPEQAATLDPSKTQRLLRSLEIISITGKTVTELQRSPTKKMLPFRFVPFGLVMPRKELYERINRRTDDMIRAGLIEEAEKLYRTHRKEENRPLPNALQTVGYRELFDYFKGKHDIGQSVALIQQHTRNYAKRQLTFFRNRLDLRWIPAPYDSKSLEECVDKVLRLYLGQE